LTALRIISAHFPSLPRRTGDRLLVKLKLRTRCRTQVHPQTNYNKSVIHGQSQNLSYSTVFGADRDAQEFIVFFPRISPLSVYTLYLSRLLGLEHPFLRPVHQIQMDGRSRGFGLVVPYSNVYGGVKVTTSSGARVQYQVLYGRDEELAKTGLGTGLSPHPILEFFRNSRKQMRFDLSYVSPTSN